MKHIRLSIERFWIETGNFELWCEILSRIPAQTEAKSMKEIASKYLNKDVVEKDKKLDRSKELFGLLGYEYHSGSEQFEIKGINFIERLDGFLHLTKEALELVEAFKNRANWEILLAKQLLRFSPRVRLIMHLLLNGGYFITNGASIENFGKWRLHINNLLYFPFASNPQKNDMNVLLEEFKKEALGNDWMLILGNRDIKLEENWSFVGVGGHPPAKTNLTAFMRAPIQLFDYLEWFIETGDGTVILNLEKMTGDLGELNSMFSIRLPEPMNEIATLKESITHFSDDRGFFPLEPVLEQLLVKHYQSWDKGLPRFVDYYLTNGVNNGIFTIVAHESGQPRHGRGYLGKREYQLVKLDIHQ